MAKKKIEEASVKEEFGNEEKAEETSEEPVEETSEEPVEEESESSKETSEEPQREMFTIKCSECGKDAEVPFKPTEGRPVYCRDCFMKHRQPRRSFGDGYNRRY